MLYRDGHFADKRVFLPGKWQKLVKTSRKWGKKRRNWKKLIIVKNYYNEQNAVLSIIIPKIKYFPWFIDYSVLEI